MKRAKREPSPPARAGECPNCGVKHRTLTPDECADRQMAEKYLQTSITGRARRRGWKTAHAGRLWLPGDKPGEGQWITPMAAGWPDLVLAKEGHRLIFMELKRELGEVDEDQWAWLRLLNQTGNFAVIIRPSDLRTGRVTAILNEGAPL